MTSLTLSGVWRSAVGAIAYCVLRIALFAYWTDGCARMELRIAYWLLRVNAPVKLTLHSIDSYCTAVRVILLTSKFNASNMREREMINRHSNILRSTNKEYMPIAIYRSEYDCIQYTLIRYRCQSQSVPYRWSGTVTSKPCCTAVHRSKRVHE